MDRLKIIYFLEDRAQEQFMLALVERIASEVSIPSRVLSPNVISGRGGSTVVKEFGKFVRDRRKAGVAGAAMIVVAVDGDCQGHAKKAAQLLKKLEPTDPFRDIVAFAIPDPHIERWYLIDQAALSRAAGLTHGIAPPAYKCRRGHYKKLLREALRNQNVPSYDGSEFGAEIARNISDLYEAGKQDPSFRKFVDDVKEILRRARSTLPPSEAANPLPGHAAPA